MSLSTQLVTGDRNDLVTIAVLRLHLCAGEPISLRLIIGIYWLLILCMMQNLGLTFIPVMKFTLCVARARVTRKPWDLRGHGLLRRRRWAGTIVNEAPYGSIIV